MDHTLFWPLALIGVLLTGISKSGFAGGAGVVAVPILALIMPVQQAATLVLPILLIMDFSTLALFRRSLQVKTLIPIGIATCVGVAIAGSLFAMASAKLLQAILAVFCLLFAVWQQLQTTLSRLPGAAYIWGTVSGISSTLLHAGGPPLSIYFLSQPIAKSQWIAQAALLFAMMNLLKLIPYTLNDLWQWRLLIIDIFLLPVALIGIKLGQQLQKHISEKRFMKICRVLLGCNGVLLLVKLMF